MAVGLATLKLKTILTVLELECAYCSILDQVRETVRSFICESSLSYIAGSVSKFLCQFVYDVLSNSEILLFQKIDFSRYLENN